MKNLKISARLSLAFAVVLLLLLAIAAFGLSSMRTVEHKLEDIVHGKNVESALATVMTEAVIQVALATRNAVLLNEPGPTQAELASVRASRDRYDEAQRKLAAMFEAGHASAPEAELLRRIDAHRQATRPLIDDVLALALKNQDDDATRLLLAEVKPRQEAWLAALHELVALEEKLEDAEAAEAAATFASARVLVGVLSALALVVGALVAWSVTRSITRPLGRAVAIASTVAAGDLTSEIRVDRSDETGALLAALKGMNDSLLAVISDVRNSTDGIANAASQIAVGSDDLSQRTEEQASSLQQTAASMEQIGATVRQNAGSAEQAARLATTAMQAASDGSAAVARVARTMDDISSSSHRIADIIGVIDGIAFQTNILALNAAVEAARAGEEGRGFAVVAAEVRGLAQRSAVAAKEVRTLIGASVAHVKDGGQLVADAAQTIGRIVAQVRDVSEIVGQISRASQEQSTGVGDVNQAVQQLDQVTAQNAALVEESAAASESLRVQARQLVETVGRFRVSA